MMLIRTLTITALLLLAGCASTVQPWERGNLAKPIMSFEPDPMDGRFTKHIYFSKEASSGGYGVGGGGCGCN
jgi:Domain of unknown function (DUF4266)